MQLNQITCPNCSHKFHLEDIFIQDIQSDLEKKFEIEKQKANLELEAKSKELELLKANHIKNKEEDEKKRIAEIEKIREELSKEKDKQIQEITSKEIEQIKSKLTEEFTAKENSKLKELEFENAKRLEEINSLRKLEDENKKLLLDQENLKKVSEDKLQKILAEKEIELKNEIRKQEEEKSQLEIAKYKLEAQEFVQKSLEDMKLEYQKSQEQILELKKIELENLKLKSEFETAKYNIEIELQKKHEEEKQQLAFTISQREQDKSNAEILQLKLAMKEKEEKLAQQENSLMEMSKKLHQGSQQSQGEAFELIIEQFLQTSFPIDKILPVPKGITGADVIFEIQHFGQKAGTIIIEAKRTKTWGKEWINKIKSDGKNISADMMIIISEVLPNEKKLQQLEGVWICDYPTFQVIIPVLREQILRIRQEIVANSNKEIKSIELYNYLTSNDFWYRFTSIVDKYNKLKAQIESEKKMFARQWAEREKLLNDVISDTGNIYGSIQAISGNQTYTIDEFELEPKQTRLLE